MFYILATIKKFSYYQFIIYKIFFFKNSFTILYIWRNKLFKKFNKNNNYLNKYKN